MDSKTICALSSASGVGAISLIRLSGENAVIISNNIFSKEILHADGYSVHFGTIKEDDKVIDEVLLTIFRAPKSFTGEDIVEIACHGSLYIQRKIIELLLKNGASMAEAGEFSKRAFFNGKMDLSQTEAIADLIHSSSAAAHQIAMNQMRGGFSNDLKTLREQLIDFASMVELELDFSEEDVEFADRTALNNLINTVLKHIEKLVHSFQIGNAIKNGIQTVIVGRPNAGKSTLLNNLLNEERAIVSDIPGTTRDTLEEVLIINGIEFRIIDTAGLREANDKIEQLGISRTLDKVKQSAILVYLYDIFETTTDEVNFDLKKLEYDSVKTIIIANKTDKSDNKIHPKAIGISALNKKGTEEVKTSLFETVNLQELNRESTIITNARHYEALILAKNDLEKVKAGLETGISNDFLAIDIRQALHHLGTITGEISSDELLGNIFANFCIGK